MPKTTQTLLPWLAISVLIFGCSKRTTVDEASGTVAVQIPVQESENSYRLKNVELFGIKNLKEVSGQFAKFFYAPGLNATQLTGNSPVAHFIKSGSFFIPTDIISTQMATIYYHMQNMAAFDQSVGAMNVNQWPRSVGLETQVLKQDDRLEKNNAFYDGLTDSMMFVPFTQSELPISFNAGIIAHEHFHSLFFKLVIKKAVSENKIALIASHSEPVIIDPKKTQRPPMSVSEKKKAALFNEFYLRGLNEGLADFWGWLYTNDVDFMKWSLPAFLKARTLTLDKDSVGEYITQQSIDSAVDDMLRQSADPHVARYDYYQIGTPHARFLKAWTQLYADENNIELGEAKLVVGKVIVNYLQNLEKTILSLEENEILKVDNLFSYFAGLQKENKNFSSKSCDFLVQYLNYGKAGMNDSLQCKKMNDQLILQKFDEGKK